MRIGAFISAAVNPHIGCWTDAIYIWLGQLDGEGYHPGIADVNEMKKPEDPHSLIAA
jgi:hypothetical protein